MFCSDAIVLADIASLLSLADPSTLPTRWAGIVSLSHPRAYNDVLAALLARGYLIADVLSWGTDPGQSYERSLALYYAACDGGGLEGYSEAFIKQFDVRESLKTVSLMAGGKIIDPAGSAGQPAGGRQSGWDPECAIPGGDPVMRRLRRGGWD